MSVYRSFGQEAPGRGQAWSRQCLAGFNTQHALAVLRRGDGPGRKRTDGQPPMSRSALVTFF